MRKKSLLCTAFIFLLFFQVVTGCYQVPYSDSYASDLEIHFLDVGQGDCIYAELPNGETLLIDAGEQENAAGIIAYIKGKGTQTLTHVIATHPHADHIGGLAEVMAAFDVKNVYMPKASSTTRTFERLLDTIEEKGLSVQTAKTGKVLFDSEGLKGEFIAPNQDRYESLNNYSAVLRLTYGETVFLLMGDAETESEKEMLAQGGSLAADVIKIGHHGSNTSTSDAFLQAVHPATAVISVGQDNSYGHPKATTLEKLRNNKVDVWRTDEKGTIILTCDGENITLSSIAPST